MTETKELTGRELDKAVAGMFGFKPQVVWAILNEDESALLIDFERQAEARKWWDEHPSIHGSQHIGTLEIYQPYSKSIAAAMRVAEKMWQAGWQVEIANSYKINTLIRDNVCVWWVRFINNENDMDNWSAEADSLPEAICRAALKAMENQS